VSPKAWRLIADENAPPTVDHPTLRWMDAVSGTRVPPPSLLRRLSLAAHTRLGRHQIYRRSGQRTASEPTVFNSPHVRILFAAIASIGRIRNANLQASGKQDRMQELEPPFVVRTRQAAYLFWTALDWSTRPAVPTGVRGRWRGF
jgi:hypothetical protein